MSLKKPVSAVRFAVKGLSFAAVGVLCLPVAAQQAIHFSKPTDQGPAVTASTFERPVSHTAPSAFNAPTPLFGSSANNSVLTPGSPLPIFPNPNAAQWQKALRDRKNWALSTPEQILGIQTPESILGVAEHPEDAKLSPEEQYLKRRDEEAQAGATNGALRSVSYASHSIWGDLDTPAGASQDSGNKNGLSGPNNRQMNPQTSENRGGLFDQSTALSAWSGDAAPATHSIWTSPFQSSEPIPKPTPQQLEGMKQFRALLDSSPAQAVTAPNSSYPDSPAATPATAVTANPFRQTQTASFNPIGSAPSALESGISKPAGITPLPGITGVRPPAPKPQPLVQPPPWMSQSPQVGVLQQRTF